MLTADNSIVRLEAIYQYTIRDVKAYSFDADDPEGTMQLAFEVVIRRNVQSRPLDERIAEQGGDRAAGAAGFPGAYRQL